MRRVQFTTGHFYHIYNRGVEKRHIYLDRRDYYRFIHDLYEMNNLKNMLNIGRNCQFHDGGPASIMKRERELIVEIHCFCCMPNHYHLILRQLQDGGIYRFMHKLGTAYAMYFNLRYKRNGVLFEGRYKAKPIEKDEYMIHLSRYIHLNPLNLFQSDWKEKGMAGREAANVFLESYRWSSYPDYIGRKNFPSVIETDFMLGYFGDKERYKKFVNGWTPEEIQRVIEG